MRLTLTTVATIVAANGLAFQQTGPAPAGGPTRIQISSAIIQAINNDPILSHSVVTATLGDDGSTTLNGAVTTQAEKDEAARVVGAIPGVKNLQNNISVSPDMPIGQSQSPAASATAPPTAPAAQPPASSAAAAPQASLSTQLAITLGSSGPLMDVAAKIEGNKIILSGSVDSQKSKQWAAELTSKVAPSYTIDNQIKISK